MSGQEAGGSIAEIVDAAFSYRGDVTVAQADGTEITGYLFNRRRDDAGGVAHLIETSTGEQIAIPYASIAAIRFTGRDTADGKHLQAFRRRHKETRTTD